MTHAEYHAAAARVMAARDHYATLGLPVAATDRDLKEAHRVLCRLFHPDLCRFPDAADLCAKVNVAYDVLSDHERRRRYDATCRFIDRKCVVCAGRGSTWRQKGFARRVEQPCTTCGGHGVVTDV